MKLTSWCWQRSKQTKRETGYFFQTYTQHKTISLKLTRWCWHWSKQTKRETGYFWSNIHTYTTQDHSVKLTRWCWQWREQTRKETGYFWSNIQKETINLPPSYWQWIRGVSRPNKKKITSGQKTTHTQNHSINSLADESKQTKRETVTSGQTYTHVHNTNSSSKTHQLMLAMKQADKKETGYTSGQISTYTCITLDNSEKLTS